MLLGTATIDESSRKTAEHYQSKENLIVQTIKENPSSTNVNTGIAAQMAYNNMIISDVEQ
jgi:hypothetical protein